MIPSPWVGLVLALGTFRLADSDTVSDVDGTCECGCGSPTRIASKTDRSKGWIKGQPLRFALGHNARVTNRPRRTSVGPEDWTVEDRGYETLCWIWKGTRQSRRTDHRRVGIDGHFEAAHRAVYARLVEPIPEGYDLHHRCEVEACVNPEHLQPLPKGEHISLHKRKLSDADVRAIRNDQRLLREIAADYVVSTTTVSDIRCGKVRNAA